MLLRSHHCLRLHHGCWQNTTITTIATVATIITIIITTIGAGKAPTLQLLSLHHHHPKHHHNFWLSSPSFSLKTLAITLSAKLPLVELYCRVATEGVRLRGGLFILLYHFIFLLYILLFLYLYCRVATEGVRRREGLGGCAVVILILFQCIAALKNIKFENAKQSYLTLAKTEDCQERCEPSPLPHRWCRPFSKMLRHI